VSVETAAGDRPPLTMTLPPNAADAAPERASGSGASWPAASETGAAGDALVVAVVWLVVAEECPE
jgi:hypothetical protein